MSAAQVVQAMGTVPGPQVPAPSQKVCCSVIESEQAAAQIVDDG
jgi:hypothetical protein